MASNNEQLYDAVDSQPPKLKAMNRLLAEEGIDLNWAASGSGYTALHRAVFRGYKNVARVLLEHGADVNAPAVATNGNIGGERPLHMAVITEGNVKQMVTMLLAAGADSTLLNGEGASPEQFAKQEGKGMSAFGTSGEPSQHSALEGGPFCPQWKTYPDCRCEGRLHRP
jgi:ankyrin repeat protein